MKSFTCVLLGSLMMVTVLAAPSDFSSFIQDREVKFNQTEINQLINELILIRPALGNTFQEFHDYVNSNSVLEYLNFVNKTKRIESERTFNLAKEQIVRNRYYVDAIVTDPAKLAEQRKTEGLIKHVLGRLNNLLVKLIAKKHMSGIQMIGKHIDYETRMLRILNRNLTYDATLVMNLLDRAESDIEIFSKFA